jgi:hypothetical protein
MSTVPTPELDKMSAVRDESQAIGEFLEWMSSRGLVFAKWVDRGIHDDELVEDRKPIKERLAEYFEIDLNKVDEEQRMLLDTLRGNNQRLTDVS